MAKNNKNKTERNKRKKLRRKIKTAILHQDIDELKRLNSNPRTSNCLETIKFALSYRHLSYITCTNANIIIEDIS